MDRIGIKRARLAEELGVSYVAVKKVLDGQTRAFTAENNSKAAAFLGVSPDWLARGEGEMLPAGDRSEPSNVVPAAIGTRRVPLISYVQAGCWTETTDPAAVGDGFEYLLTDLELSGSAFALQIEGESMLPQFKPGDRVIVDPEIYPQPGDFVVAMNGGHEATFKKYRPRSMDEAGNVLNSPYLVGRSIRVVVDDTRDPGRAEAEQKILGSLVKAMTLSKLRSLRRRSPAH